MRSSRSLALLVFAGIASATVAASAQPAALVDRIVGNLSLGQSASDYLSGTEPTDLVRYAAYDGWAFTGTAGQLVEFTMSSDAFDSYLQLEDPSGTVIASDDDSGGNLNSRIRLALPTSGTYVLMASSYSGGTGNYTVGVREPSIAPLTLNTGEIGQTHSGNIDAGDYATTYNGNAEAWDVELGAGQRLTAIATSSDMLLWLRVLSPAGEVIQEASSYAYGAPATVTVNATATGMYRVVVAAYDASSSGAYSLQLTDAPAPPPAGGTMELGEDMEGAITATDPVNPSAQASDTYGIELEAGDTVTVTLTGVGFDPYLTVYDATGTWLAGDDDSAGNLNSRTTFTAYADGIYRIEASTYNGAFGTYTLTALKPERGEPDIEEAELGDTVSGRLEEGDGLNVYSSSYVDVYEVEVDEGGEFAVSVSSPVVGTTVSVSLVAPTFEVFSTTSNDPYYSVPAEVTNAIGGTWRLVVTTYSLAEVDYTITLSDSAYGDLPAIDLDESTAGVLNETDGRGGSSGGLSDEYLLEITEAGVYEIVMSTTNGSDAYLEVNSTDYAVSTMMGDYASATATVRYFLPAGTYRVTASSAYGLDGTGYTLLAKQGQASSLTARALVPNQPVTISPSDIAMGAFNTNLAAFYFDGTVGQNVTIDFSGGYGYATLNSPVGDWVASGYDDGTMTHMSMTAMLPASGRYYVQFAPYSTLTGPVSVTLR